MILFSDGEAAPQVVMEALVAGLGLVISEEAAANLDTTLPFIDVVKSDCPPTELAEILIKNREISLSCRKEIREYGIERFGLTNCTKAYINKIIEIRGLK
jgi:glycosyltransferase involved in cell wall biosynthesis